ncbi:hypothetical protein ACFFLM_04350 [Deinococcus oregonensis]|uniref:Uncharacterized protein n=1 Tax=Deinococcus oregonensis TaxID=1805970 RepID=A0ABV6AUP1_9DEIO
MSGFFSFLAAVAFIAMIVFIIQARKKRPGAGKKAWMSVGAWIVLGMLSNATMTGAERAKVAAQQQAEEQAAAQAERQRVVASQQAAAKREAAAAAQAKIEAEQSIDESTLVVACKAQIRSQLKLPNTAKFAGFLESVDQPPVIGKQDAYWKSWVEAENSFGGTVRNDFICSYVKATDRIQVQMTQR